MIVRCSNANGHISLNLYVIQDFMKPRDNYQFTTYISLKMALHEEYINMHAN
jgi:hypothetical protein